MWEELPIERDLENALVAEFGNNQGKTLLADYTSARTRLPDIWDYIRRREPDLTDHGERHIKDVLTQAHLIIPPNHLTARELLALAISILFHDTGNVHGREHHERKVSEIYDFVRGTPTPSLSEKQLVLAVVGAHGGVARNGSKDTIRDLLETEPYLSKAIRVREIAAILRFADELAEGPQRTSEYLRREHAFDIHSETFHNYAAITNICVDRGNERIALTYHIPVPLANNQIDEAQQAQLIRLLEFAYYRIRKLDQERQYARYYSSGLTAFKKTSATFHFWMNGQKLELGLEPLELTDLIVPGGDGKQIPDINAAYKIESILAAIKGHIPVVRNNSAMPVIASQGT